jgi:sugar lactone lactonase YvrE
MRYAAPLAFVLACAPPAEKPAAPLPHWTFDPSMVFPADRSLVRPEDGVALPDGRLLISDQVSGLRLVQTDGTSAPFGDLAGAGYLNTPPTHSGAINGVSLEPDGTHLVLADILGGGIYRVDIATGETELVYQHSYGVNTAVRDTHGNIWFTQSTKNTPQDGEGRMFAAVDFPEGDGSLWRLRWTDGTFASEAEALVENLRFANGVVIDTAAGRLYLAETVGNRVLQFDLDPDTGELSGQSTLLDITAPDNLELDGQGRLWVALPVRNELIVVNTGTGEYQSVFRSQTPAQEALAAEFVRRGEAGEPRLDLMTPDLWAPLPGLMTGAILAPGGVVYFTGIGDAIVRLGS